MSDKKVTRRGYEPTDVREFTDMAGVRHDPGGWWDWNGFRAGMGVWW